MSVVKRLLEERGRGNRNLYQIGPDNQFIGQRLRVTWLKPWGKKPKGFTAEGELLTTFCVKGRTLIGELKVATGQKLSCPWSRNWLEIEVLRLSISRKGGEKSGAILEASEFGQAGIRQPPQIRHGPQVVGATR